MSDVNEFNVSTQEKILRPYTEQEKEQIQEMALINSVVIIDSSLSFEAQKISHRQQLLELGMPEEKINEILGND